MDMNIREIENMNVNIEDDDQKYPQNDRKSLTFEALKNMTQFSDQQLLNCLENEIGAFLINEEYYILDDKYSTHVFNDILLSIKEQKLLLDNPSFIIESVDILKTLTIYPQFVIDQCLKLHSIKVRNISNGSGHMLDEKKVCLFLAKKAWENLREWNINFETDVWTVRSITDDEFIKEWKKYIPGGMTSDISMLKGHCFKTYDETKYLYTRQWLEEKDLSLDVEERFGQLFKVNEKWSLDEIEPYIEVFVTKNTTLKKLLQSHTNVISGKKNNVMFVAKDE